MSRDLGPSDGGASDDAVRKPGAEPGAPDHDGDLGPDSGLTDEPVELSEAGAALKALLDQYDQLDPASQEVILSRLPVADRLVDPDATDWNPAQRAAVELYGLYKNDDGTYGSVAEDYARRGKALPLPGWATSPSFRDLSSGETDDAESRRFVEAIRQIPGIDPIKAVLDGDMVPTNGWLMSASIGRTGEGVLRIYGGPGDLSIADARESYGTRYASLKTNGTEYTVACEPPNYGFRDVEPFNRTQKTTYTGLGFEDTDIIDLAGGGRLLSEKSPRSGSLFTRLNATVLSDEQRDYRTVEVGRMAADLGSLAEILVYTGKAMNLSLEDAQKMAETALSKAINGGHGDRDAQ